MNTFIPAALLPLALFSTLSATAAADPAIILYPETAPEMVASLTACARAASQDGYAARLNVVRYVEHVGSGNYEYWINAAAPLQTRTYCRTAHDQVALVQSFDGLWTGSRPSRPEQAEQIANSATVSTQSRHAVNGSAIRTRNPAR